MRIAISAGHNVYIDNVFDPGAVRYPYVEADLNKETVKLLIPMLERQGHTVLDVTPYNQHFKSSREHHVVRCNKADEFKADMFIDVHHNAGGGTGSEILVYSTKSPSYERARKILNHLHGATGLRNRGVLVKPAFWSVSLCKAPAMITEGGFVDSDVDMKALTPLKYAESIAKAFGPVEKKEEQLKTIFISLHGTDIDAEGMMLNGTNYIPVRFLENMGYEVDWKDGKVVINYRR